MTRRSFGFVRVWSLLSLALLGTACGGGYALTQPDQTYYLQTNLRATSRGVVSSILGWRGTDVVPVCTPVRVTAVKSREITFEDIETGERFQYVLHRTSRLGVEEHLARYFGTSCAPEVDAADLHGIEEGLVEVGMTRPGVLVALGYPPEHRTPNLTDPSWMYWGESGRVVVSFAGDRVASITDERGRPLAGGTTYVATAPIAEAPVTEAPVTEAPITDAPSGELQVIDGATLAVDADGTVVVPGSVVVAPGTVAPDTVTVEVDASASVAVEREPRDDGRRRRRRRRLITAGVIVGAAAVTTGVAVASHRANRADRTGGSSVPTNAPSTASASAQATPTTTVVREAPRGGRLFDRCGGGASGCGAGLTCDASSSQCRLSPGYLGEAPPCREDRECPTGTVCGVSRLTPERGALCWQPDVVGR